MQVSHCCVKIAARIYIPDVAIYKTEQNTIKLLQQVMHMAATLNHTTDL